MKPDLIFHLVPKRKWKDWQSAGDYKPETDNQVHPGWILCFTGGQVEQFANKQYSDRKNILMLVINTKRLSEKIEYREIDGEEYPMIENRINLDAILDKIRLMPNQEGIFEIDVVED